jgi:hypothetical protein
MLNSISGLISFVAALLVSQTAMSHGDGKPGPNGGAIQMPGSYHTELVLNDSEIRVYLLDFNFKNPVTKDSSVALKITSDGAKAIEAECKAAGEFFKCAVAPSSYKATKGQIEVISMRSKEKGAIAKYNLPIETAPQAKMPAMPAGHEHH